MPSTHRTYWVYILANQPHGTLYIGVTNSLRRRVWEHRSGSIQGFTRRYGLKTLVFFEEYRDITNAITRETTLKGWRRSRKVELIERNIRFGPTSAVTGIDPADCNPREPAF